MSCFLNLLSPNHNFTYYILNYKKSKRKKMKKGPSQSWQDPFLLSNTMLLVPIQCCSIFNLT